MCSFVGTLYYLFQPVMASDIIYDWAFIQGIEKNLPITVSVLFSFVLNWTKRKLNDLSVKKCLNPFYKKNKAFSQKLLCIFILSSWSSCSYLISFKNYKKYFSFIFLRLFIIFKFAIRYDVYISDISEWHTSYVMDSFTKGSQNRSTCKMKT